MSENAFGHDEPLDTIVVCVNYPPDGHTREVELVVEPRVCLGGSGRWYPGVVYRPEYYTLNQFGEDRDIGEIIAYGINEGRTHTGDVLGERREGNIFWSVTRGAEVLREYGIIE